MADFNKPDNTTLYNQVLDLIKDMIYSCAKWFDGTFDTNLKPGFKRFFSTNRRFEVFNGSAWVELLDKDNKDTPYEIRVRNANVADSAKTAEACSGEVEKAGLATNALSLGGVAASQYVRTNASQLTDSRKCNPYFENAEASRGNLDVYKKADVYTKTESDTGFCKTGDSRLSDSRKCNNTFLNPANALENLGINIGNRLMVKRYRGLYPLSELGTSKQRMVAEFDFTPQVFFVFINTMDRQLFAGDVEGLMWLEENKLFASARSSEGFLNNGYDCIERIYMVLAFG